jgi:solute carrier family 23 (nucleobase transporter), member 1
LSAVTEKNQVIYGLDDVPKPIGRAIFLGLQHVLTMFGATVAVPLILGPAMGFNAAEIGTLVSSVMIASGVATALQVNIGTRLPIIQGVSFAFLGTFFAIIGQFQRAEAMQYIAGAIMLGALVEMAVGWGGLIGKLRRLITPVVIGPVIALIGLALFEVGALYAGSNWWMSGLTILLAFVFSLVMARRHAMFKLFPILLAVVLAYLVALVASLTGIVGPGSPTYVDLSGVGQADLFRWNVIFPWGIPKFHAGFFLAVLAAYLASMIESFGDYHAIASVSGAGDPTEQQINKGIGSEGLGCFLTGVFGGFASTSYTENIGLVGLTRVASRYVANIAAIILVVLGLFPPFGAVVATIPMPVIGGLYCALFGLIASVGLANTMKADMTSQRNLMIIGFIFFMGLAVPAYFKGAPGLFEGNRWSLEGAQWVADIVNTIGTTGMAVAAILGLLLDNLLPGTDEERGITRRAA